jgi:hypothetical protein
MSIIYSDDSGQVIWPDADLHDPSSKKYYYIDYRPPTRVSSKEYIKGLDVIVPTTANGCMYECISGGISASVEPVFDTTEGKTTDDGTVRWKCLPATTRLLTGDAITTSTWTSTVGVTTELPVILDTKTTGIKVTLVDPLLKKFTLTNTITILRSSGRIEERIKSLVVTVGTL